MAEGISGLSDVAVRQVQYLIDVKGLSAANELRTALAAVDTQIARQKADFDAGTITYEQFIDATRRLAGEQIQLAGQIKLAEAAMASGGAITANLVQDLRAAERAASAMGGAFAMARQSAQAFQKFGYLADDLQYLSEQGLRPVINNLFQLHPIAGLVGIAADQMWKNWSRLSEVFGQGATMTEADAMEWLAKASNSAAEALERTVAAKKEEQEIAARRAAAPKEESDQAKAVTDILVEKGGKGLAERLARMREAVGDARTTPQEEEELKELADMEAGTSAGSARQMARRAASAFGLAEDDETYIARRREEIHDAQVHRADQDLTRAGHDPEQLKTLVAEFTRLGMPKDLTSALADAAAMSPAEKKARDKMIEEDETASERLTKRSAARRAAENEKSAAAIMPGIITGETAPDTASIRKEIGRVTGSEADEETAAAVDKIISRKIDEAIKEKLKSLPANATPDFALEQLGDDYRRRVRDEIITKPQKDEQYESPFDKTDRIESAKEDRRVVREEKADIRKVDATHKKLYATKKKKKPTLRRGVHRTVAAGPDVGRRRYPTELPMVASLGEGGAAWGGSSPARGIDPLMGELVNGIKEIAKHGEKTAAATGKMAHDGIPATYA